MIQYIEKKCLFCDNDCSLINLYDQTFKDEDLNPEVFSARRVTEHYHYQMVRCTKTGLIFSRRILSDEVLGELYKESTVNYSTYTDIISHDYWKPLERFSHILNKGKALEIGCGNGFFLEKLLEKGFKQVYGCEPSIQAKEIASAAVKSSIYTGLFEEGIYDNNSMDLICCFQTFDHVSEPIALLQQCKKVLKPAGLAYFVMHNTEALQAKLLKDKSPIIDVEHIYLFNKHTIQLAFEKAGFKVISVFPISNSYPIRYWLTMAPIPFKKTVSRVFNVTGLSNIRVSLSIGNMGIIAQKV